MFSLSKVSVKTRTGLSILTGMIILSSLVTYNALPANASQEDSEAPCNTNPIPEECITNTATVSSNTEDPNQNNNTDFVSNPILRIADLAVEKTDGLDSIKPEERTTYTIKVTNKGPSKVQSLKLTDTIPDQIENSEFKVEVGQYDESSKIWSNIDLAAGQSIELVLNAKVKRSAEGDIVNQVSVEAPEGTTDPDLSNNQAEDLTKVNPLADLELKKTSSGKFISGTEASYTLKVTNQGPSRAKGPITIKDKMPNGVSFVRAEGSEWTCTQDAGMVTCVSNNELQDGQSREVKLIVKVE
ncbi:MAG: hypothetical protein OHK0017_02210 [Patescibacteria group bacterium]